MHPDGHAVTPSTHGLPVLQLTPPEHTLQLPLPSHKPLASPLPHGVEGDAFPVGTQTGPPVAHEIAPRVHGLPVLHGVPLAHTTHAPAPLHTPPVHGLPAFTFPANTHVAMPVLQSVVPSVQALPIEQLTPALQALQLPRASHTPTPPRHAVPIA